MTFQTHYQHNNMIIKQLEINLYHKSKYFSDILFLKTYRHYNL